MGNIVWWIDTFQIVLSVIDSEQIKKLLVMFFRKCLKYVKQTLYSFLFSETTRLWLACLEDSLCLFPYVYSRASADLTEIRRTICFKVVFLSKVPILVNFLSLKSAYSISIMTKYSSPGPPHIHLFWQTSQHLWEIKKIE